MPEITDRFISHLVSRLAAQARREGLPRPKTSAQVMERIRESSAETAPGESISSRKKLDFQAVLAAHLKRHR